MLEEDVKLDETPERLELLQKFDGAFQRFLWAIKDDDYPAAYAMLGVMRRGARAMEFGSGRVRPPQRRKARGAVVTMAKKAGRG